MFTAEAYGDLCKASTCPHILAQDSQGSDVVHLTRKTRLPNRDGYVTVILLLASLQRKGTKALLLRAAIFAAMEEGRDETALRDLHISPLAIRGRGGRPS